MPFMSTAANELPQQNARVVRLCDTANDAAIGAHLPCALGLLWEYALDRRYCGGSTPSRTQRTAASLQLGVGFAMEYIIASFGLKWRGPRCV